MNMKSGAARGYRCAAYGRLLRTCLFLCFLCACLLPALSGCRNGRLSAYSYSGGVSVTVGLGTRVPLSPGRTIPVSVAVSGDYAAADHTVTVTVPTGEADFYCYRQQLSGNDEEQVSFAVQAAEGSSQMVVEVLDGKGSVVYSRTCSYRFSDLDGKDGEIVIGLIGTEANAGRWNYPYVYGDYHLLVRSVEIEPENLLSIPQAYEQYNLLVMTASAVEQLSDAQKEGIRSWVYQGGRLLLAGSRQTSQQIGLSNGSRTESASFADNAYVNGYEEDRGRLWLMIPSMFEQEFTEDEQMTLLEILMNGNLKTELFRESNRKKLETAVGQVLDGQESITRVADTRVYYAIFAVYLLVILPGVWLFLRQKDRLGWFRSAACVLSVAVCAAVWIAGSRTRVSSPFLHELTLYNYSGESVKRDTYFSVQAPANSAYEVSLIPGCEVMPMQQDTVWNGTAYNQYGRHTAELLPGTEETLLQMDNLVAFAPRYFQLSGETKTEETITGSMEWDGTQIDGTLTNGLEKDMSQVLVVAGDRVCLLDEWKHGETLTLSGEANAGRGQWVALETYLEGSYRKRDGWDTSCQVLYELLTRSHSLLAYQEFLVVGRIDCDQTVQQNTDYRTSNISFAVAKVRAD